jgi:hypothetical protein
VESHVGLESVASYLLLSAVIFAAHVGVAGYYAVADSGIAVVGCDAIAASLRECRNDRARENEWIVCLFSKTSRPGSIQKLEKSMFYVSKKLPTWYKSGDFAQI